MSAPLGRVDAERRHAGGRREATARWLCTVGCVVTLALGVLVVPFTSCGAGAGQGLPERTARMRRGA